MVVKAANFEEKKGKIRKLAEAQKTKG